MQNNTNRKINDFDKEEFDAYNQDMGAATPVPTISVIVPTHNGGDQLRDCLESVVNAPNRPEEIIVVVDGGDDDVEALRRDYGVSVLEMDKKGGPARARNAGAKIATGDILFFVDADVTVSVTAFDQLRTLFGEEAGVAAAIGSYDDEPAAPNFLAQYRNLFHHYVHQNAQEEGFTFWGACGAVRRDAFLKVGGFDETYSKPSIEDIELGYRLKKAGYRIRLKKTLQIKHLKQWTFYSMLKADFWYRALPWTKLILQDQTLSNDLNLDYRNRVSVMMAFTMVLGLLASLVWGGVAGIAAISGGALFLLNAPLYRFFWHKRGLWFAMLSVPWHWFYFLYGGLAFALGTAGHLIAGERFTNKKP